MANKKVDKGKKQDLINRFLLFSHKATTSTCFNCRNCRACFGGPPGSKSK